MEEMLKKEIALKEEKHVWTLRLANMQKETEEKACQFVKQKQQLVDLQKEMAKLNKAKPSLLWS
jgi:hypothetical protein